MLTCVIIEDQPLAQRMLHKYISQSGHIMLKATFTDPIRAADFLKTQSIDLIFLDIHLPKMSGLDFLRSNPNHPKVILTTAFPEYALESYQFNVVDYLLKPFTYDRFMQAISKLESMLKVETEPVSDNVIIKSGYDFIQLPAAAIIYIKSDADYTEVFTGNRSYLSKESLKEWLAELDPSTFCQIHKSYIINILHFKRISGNTVYIKDMDLPIGRVYKKRFVEHYLK
nr:LytTR family DNA-binding domain-containing protein [Allomuricauda sp.]